ncbi:hypothetical protein N7448_008521 [Penicillium atrosanguineum]|uniref:Aspartate aminotransferase n=1 Tax=Penicillium atrosanguineum TaxID=1132637 RepID=A0A9W9KZ51_9EURO|nr:high-affinity nicotinic acid transporter [Penicillium atrosanguineum]KAJ5127742.1 hypothetical protein N7448_008521 [Penicillium atrosanguineum]KAJ5147951.1 hypothetical protein N7526_001303 [Penicillium atrosanguineum]KAJ5313580.1 high-affinity nicotinic acid transporter [Penicillium atrosanguineum]KAJ5330754.1 hypothetical protein N7476_000537 [Penicillium atrosanguineum]
MTYPSILSDLPELPLAESFALTEAYNLDTFPEKVNLGQGVYRDEECQSWVLPSVRSAEEFLHQQHLNHEYLPIPGAAPFIKEAQNLVFGPQLAQKENIRSVQTVAGTGANHLAALFCARYLRPKNVFISDPTWDNHQLIWETAGPGIERKLYPYYDPSTRSLHFDGMTAELENSAEENDVVILHACAHNPTGIDPTQTQWKKIAEIVAKKRLFVVFDSAYQGFASGDPDADAWAIRYFYSTFFGDASLSTSAIPAGMIVCQSFSKNFGLYGERIGALHLITPPSVSPWGAYTHLVRLIRSEISCPSLFGARCVHTILTDLDLRSKWIEDVKTMASRIQSVRTSLKSELENIGAQGDWDYIERQIGMFSYTGLSKIQVHRLKQVHHIYMLENGRMSLSGLNGNNVAYVARAIKDVVDRH